MNNAIGMTQQISGHISLSVLNAQGEVVKEIPEFRNLITDSGLNRLLAPVGTGVQDMASFCKVGTGAGVPATTDTVLPGFLISTAVTEGSGAFQATTLPYYFEATYTYLFPLGAIAATLTCIGAHDTGGTSSVFAWSQIKDSGNNPTTITVLSSEQLSVTYKFRVYAPAFTTSGSILISGDASHDFTMYAYGFSTGGFGLSNGSVVPVPSAFMQATRWTTITDPVDIKGNPVYTGANTINMTLTNGSYTPGSFTRTMTGFMGTTSNVTGNSIMGIILRTAGQGPNYLMKLVTPIPKDTTKTLSLTFSYSLARYP
jgi:hypothetical protein